ncbi:MAG: DUF5058 family protein [Eubacteriales bacterium]|nr:DUF5058 family protein [Eubacteriales bacterium]
MFHPNDGFLYGIVAVVIAFVVAMSVFFLVKAWRRAKALGMDMGKLKKIAVSAGVFTIAPAVAILLGVIALSKALGFPLPWLRLTVIGALTYETTAAATASSAVGQSLSNMITDPKAFAAIAWVMTVGILPGTILVPTIGKKLENGIIKLKQGDSRWGEIFQSSLFLGMISAFLGVVFAHVTEGLAGWIPVFVMLAGAVIMLLCGALVKGLKWRWMENYALPISMLSAMALSIPITSWITGLA